MDKVREKPVSVKGLATFLAVSALVGLTGCALLAIMTPVEWPLIAIGFVLVLTCIFFVAYWGWLDWIRKESNADSKKMAILFNEI